MSDIILETKGLTKHYGGVHALNDANFTLKKGEHVAIMGDNGAGKSTFVRQITGVEQRTSGDIIFAGQPVGIKLNDRGYSLVQWRRDGWRPAGRPEILPNRLSIELQTERPPRPETWPEMVFDPTGIIEPAAFQLQGRGVRIEIARSETGEVNLVER